MANEPMDLSRPGMPAKMDITKSKYNIYARPSFKHAPTRADNGRMVNTFIDDLIAFLDSYRAAMDVIAADLTLSNVGHTLALTALREKLTPPLQNYAKRVFNLVEEYEKKKKDVFKPQAFPTSGDKGADEVRAVEIRSLVRDMGIPEQVELYLKATTPLEVIAAIENSPFPMLPKDILSRGKEGQLMRSAHPDALESLADQREMVEVIRLAVVNAFMWAESPIPPEPALREALEPLPE